jgi:lipopolysaccharide/colanic/teichoic acid biosynthesis glycosyltransferase|tara:strand:- start:2932 stop:3453 length:522 start_codon:yes stop_codon:yes gene_type:complete
MLLVIFLLFFQGGNVFFTQLRPGKNEEIFKLYKFKTMKDTISTDGELLPDHLRTTRIGKFVRSTSLDEIPQLLNVLKGEMSFIGPRPLLIKYLPMYNNEQRKRHDVKPGITGLAQVKGRNKITWDKRFELDLEYVNNQGFILDLQIFLLTIKKVILREDINTSNNETMKSFKN